tara:strand:+ start:294 stop:557 length:264 start_codon:yes stop_codon:yes gene_type:complete
MNYPYDTADFHTDDFHYDKSTKKFTAEASELGLKPGFIPMEIILTSARTGDRVNFTLDYIEDDGSLKFEAGRLDLKAMGVTVYIIND